jgi:hypothetical protein
VVIPKGAVITGRVTRIFSYTLRSMPYFVVGLRFQSIEFGGRHGDFAGEVGAAGITSDFVAGQGQSGESFISVKSRVERVPAGTRLLIYTR